MAAGEAQRGDSAERYADDNGAGDPERIEQAGEILGQGLEIAGTGWHRT